MAHPLPKQTDSRNEGHPATLDRHGAGGRVMTLPQETQEGADSFPLTRAHVLSPNWCVTGVRSLVKKFASSEGRGLGVGLQRSQAIIRAGEFPQSLKAHRKQDLFYPIHIIGSIHHMA